MEYYGHNDWRDYHLAHYGKKGMKWGKSKKKNDYQDKDGHSRDPHSPFQYKPIKEMGHDIKSWWKKNISGSDYKKSADKWSAEADKQAALKDKYSKSAVQKSKSKIGGSGSSRSGLNEDLRQARIAAAKEKRAKKRAESARNRYRKTPGSMFSSGRKMDSPRRDA